MVKKADASFNKPSADFYESSNAKAKALKSL